ncbi:DUF6515 family protein [Spongiivirga citrea]|uniref:Uncharacterized protein n=1 Tax=Spongiivirga citrea TaxID=1481457 RepID=A0A6M0CN36_9FLAO|nr:DUF6515 family protein [Spongiivirga citrea]NER17269.1 hypothetical protein [Spongiivirga citrea]
MKNFKNISRIAMIISICFFLPNRVEAQLRKTTVVKQTTVKRGVIRKRPVKVRRVAHVRYRHLPRWGATVRRIGFGYRTIAYRGVGFRFYKGIWYRPSGRRLVVARAPFGVRVKVLPVGYSRFVIGLRPYFYYYGTFYTKVDGTDEYQVVEPPIGAEIDALPDGYKIVEVNGQEYYKLENTYYEAHIDDNENEYYVVVADPTR